MKLLNNREKIAYEMKKQGYTFKKIGQALDNVSPNRAQQIYKKATYKINQPPSFYDGLNSRAANTLRNMNIKDKNSAIDAIKKGLLHPNNRKPMNYGWKSHKEVYKWLNLPEPITKRKPQICPYCGKDINNYYNEKNLLPMVVQEKDMYTLDEQALDMYKNLIGNVSYDRPAH